MRRLSDALRRIGPIWRRRPRRFFVIAQLARLGVRVRFRRDGFRWIGFSWDRDITWGLFVDGLRHRAALGAVFGWLGEHRTPPRGGVVVNVGANIGSVALPIARDLGCRVLAIEPEPENFELLERNVRRNRLDGLVDCVACAVAEPPGRVSLLLPPSTSGGPELMRPGTRPASLSNHEGTHRTVSAVRAERLSTLLAQHGIRPRDVALVWSDTQGSEGHVIATAPELWAAGVPLLIELWPAGLRHQGAYDTIANCAEHGFSEFIELEDLVSGDAAWRSIAELRELMQSLSGNEQTDVLLVPGEPDADGER